MERMHWNDGWHGGGGPWWWLFMLLMMVIFWGAVAWVIVTLIRHASIGARAPHDTARTTAEDILHERLARGEIDVEEYHQRLDALRIKQPPR